MVQFYEHLWIGKKAAVLEDKLRSATEKGSVLPGGYYIILSEKEGRLMEILPCGLPLSSLNVAEDCLVIGLACGKKEAANVAAGIIDTLYRTTGGFDLRAYLREMR